MKKLNEISYPVYRQYKNGLSWFRIESPERFTEVRKMGSVYLVTVLEAKILPDRNLIHDLVLDYFDFAFDIPAEIFENVLVLASK